MLEIYLKNVTNFPEKHIGVTCLKIHQTLYPNGGSFSLQPPVFPSLGRTPVTPLHGNNRPKSNRHTQLHVKNKEVTTPLPLGTVSSHLERVRWLDFSVLFEGVKQVELVAEV